VLIGEVSGLLLAAVIVGTMLLLLGLGVWIGLALIGVAFVAMVTGSSRMPGDAMATTIFGSLSSWDIDLSALVYLDGRDFVSVKNL